MSLTSAPAVGVLYSGGLDSSILLLKLLAEGRAAQPIYVVSGLTWEAAEQRAAAAFLAAIATPRLSSLVTLALPLGDVYQDHWSITGRDIPAADSPDAAVYLPGRNPLLAIKALLWCQTRGITELAIGCLSSSPFVDASENFLNQFAALMDAAAGGAVRIVRPLADKLEGLRWGRAAPLELTLSCFAPHGKLHCGQCNKCAERQAAFAAAGISDRTRYARPSARCPVG